MGCQRRDVEANEQNVFTDCCLVNTHTCLERRASQRFYDKSRPVIFAKDETSCVPDPDRKPQCSFAPGPGP